MSRRGSSLFPQGTGMGAPMAGGIGFDYDSESDEEPQKKSAPQQAQIPPGAGTGGPNHRPMVGGFAAAAYEAARAHHYAMKQKQQKQAQAKSRPPASRPRATS